MGRVILSEVKTGVFNKKFLLGIMLTGAILIIIGYPYYQQILQTGLTGNEPAWYSLFQYSVFSEHLMWMIPLSAPLAYGGEVECELKCRFSLFSYYRSGKKAYVLGKYLAALFSGGLMILVTIMLFLLICIIGMLGVTDSQGTNIGIFVQKISGDCIRLFLNGGLWAVIGSLSAILCKNSHISFTVPFILYYVLTVFQSRYYSTISVLSPRYWATPMHYSSLSCSVILLFLLFLCGCVYWIAIKRRMKHV